MNRILMLVALSSIAIFGGEPAFGADALDKTKQAAVIERDFGLKAGTIIVKEDGVHLVPSPDEPYENLDCALTRLRKEGLGKLGFVGNEVDPNTILEPPLRYIAEGPDAEVAALVKAARAERWVVIRTSAAPDGMTIVQLESGTAMTHGQAARLLDRIWKKEFGDIAFGIAPRKLSDPNPFEE
jgi:hypothetical protein